MWRFLKRPITGLVLGGGGARGFFHIGVIKAIQERHIKIDEIAGTSIGAIVAAVYASNPSVDFEKIVSELNFLQIIRLIKSPLELEKYLRQFIPVRRFEDLKIKLKFNAADINNRQEIVFDHGDIFPGLIASISLPGIFTPVHYSSRFLLDGGLVNNVPFTLLESANHLIVSDITGPIKKVTDRTSSVDTLYSSIAFMQQQSTLQKMKLLKGKYITYLRLNDESISIFDFRRQNYQNLIDQGYDTAISKL